MGKRDRPAFEFLREVKSPPKRPSEFEQEWWECGLRSWMWVDHSTCVSLLKGCYHWTVTGSYNQLILNFPWFVCHSGPDGCSVCHEVGVMRCCRVSRDVHLNNQIFVLVCRWTDESIEAFTLTSSSFGNDLCFTVSGHVWTGLSVLKPFGLRVISVDLDFWIILMVKHCVWTAHVYIYWV